MPEGPEVQVIVDALQPLLSNTTIAGIARVPERNWVVAQSLIQAIGDKILSVSRLGKFIVLTHLSTRRTVIHLSFTGHFSLSPVDFMACKLYLDNETVVYFSDKRGLGKLRNMSHDEFVKDKTLSSHTTDGLLASEGEIYTVLSQVKIKRINREIKPFLTDYKYICGIGNIYASEICFATAINPKTKVSELSEDQLRNLSSTIKTILTTAYQAGGSSIESFSSINNQKGHAQEFHKVYHKDFCEICGSKILSFKQEGRTTFYCPKCQGGNL